MSDPVLRLPPDQSGYQLTFGERNVSVQLQGGASRFRADLVGAVSNLVCTWTIDEFNAAYLMAFYRTATQYGALPFTVGLYMDDGTIRDYTAHFVPGTFNLVSQQGKQFVYGATLEILPNDSYASGDTAILTAGPH